MTFWTDKYTPADLYELRLQAIQKLKQQVNSGDLTDYDLLDGMEKQITIMRNVMTRLDDPVDCLKCKMAACYSYESASIQDSVNCIYQRFTHCDKCGTQVDPVKWLYRGNGKFEAIPADIRAVITFDGRPLQAPSVPPVID